MKRTVAKVVSVNAGFNDDLSKKERRTIQVELDGVIEVAIGVTPGEGFRKELLETPSWLLRSPD